MEDNKTIKSRPKEFFLHLLAVVTLYISAGGLITLLFQFLNYLLPDLPQNQYEYSSWVWPMRMAVASLIIVFPVFVGVSRYLNGLYGAEPDLRDLRVRRWLLNFTLFVAALVIIGDCVSLIYNFISGEIALRFALKAMSILSVAGLIFGYYFLDLKRELAEAGFVSMRAKKIISYIAIVAVSLLVSFSFFVMGSPFSARERNIDAVRVSNLQQIQYAIINFWQAKNVMPQNLSELNDATRGVAVPTDPETGAAYTYNVTGGLAFDLCANFKTVSQPADARYSAPAVPYGAANDNWSHVAGNACFHRSIDPAFYPPFSKPLSG